MADLQELYYLNKVSDLDVRPVPTMPTDTILAKLLHKHPEKIYKYHIHDSLLEDKPDEDLTEAQKVAAWTRFTATANQITDRINNCPDNEQYDEDGVRHR